ncbi:MAG: type III polyketide synthase [Bacteroidales bacterium]|nr:type III polyketide synthase [Bacteroidales bacterium]
MSRIISIGTAVPEYATPQSVILGFMHAAYQNKIASRKLNILFHNSGIDTRYSVVPDFNNGDSEHNFFSPDQPLPDVEKRIGIYKKNAASLAVEAIRHSVGNLKTTVSEFGITHLITVSCTGIYAPGLGTDIMEQLGLPGDIFTTSINYMGCNAAFPALKIADMIARTDKNARVMVVCVELCTIHFQPKDNHDNLLSNTIFGDGAAAVVVVSDEAAVENRQSGLTLNGFYSLLLSNGKDLMGWNITPVNFEMVLDAGIPAFISDEVMEILQKAGKKLEIDPSSVDKWAIHPGGKSILDAIKKRIPLNESDLQYSYKVLARYGNMSSPTILFVLNEMLESGLRPEEKIFSIGFGPGISIETALFTYAG